MGGSRCDSCGKQIDGKATTTVTGRRLCSTCADELTGMAAGFISAGGTSPEATGQAIATGGFFSRWRARRSKE